MSTLPEELPSGEDSTNGGNSDDIPLSDNNQQQQEQPESPPQPPEPPSNNNSEKMTIIDETENNLTDSILRLLTSDDMQRLLDGDCLKLFFRDYLKQLPVKCVAEVLSVLIAVLKKSLLNLESAKEILIDCLKHYCNKCISSSSSTTTSNGENKVSTSTSGTDNLIKHFLREIINLLSSYSCDVEKLKYLLASSQEDSRLLHIIRSANSHQKGRPSSFFAFPGTKGSVLALPPLVKWPIQNGWTFISWFRLEPNSINSQPYLYFFRTSKSGVGYSAHFTGNCLVLTSMKIKGKGYQHCIPYEFVPFKWYHCAIAYVAKWRSSEIKVFVNGQLTANTEMSWQVQTQDIFDKCFIGGTADLVSESHLFCGQLSAIYLLHEALNPSQICAIHRLGPSYMGQYRYPNEMGLFDNMPMMMKKVLYEEKLSTTLISLYTPVAVEGDTLCLQSAPKGNVSYFASSPHAALLGNTKAITTRSISDTLQSIGGIKALLPLLNRFTGLHGTLYPADSEACSTLIGFICDLLESSPLWFGNEVVQSHGFVIISSLLAKNPRYLINEETLEIILNLTKTLMSAMSTSSLTSSTGDSILLKQLMDSILFNSSLWIYVDSKLQIRLYCYLATEFLTVGAAASSSSTSLSSSSSSPGSNCDISSTVTRDSGNDSLNSGSYSSMNTGVGSSSGGPNGGVSSPGGGVIFSEVRRISTVLQLLHSLKYYYWLVPEDVGGSHDSHGLPSTSNMTTTTLGIYSISTQPVQVKARESCYRPSKNDLISIRSYILLFIKQLIIKGNGVHHDELQAILNYLSTVHQDANLLDVLQMLQTLMVEHPSSMIPAFDMKNGVRTVFKLVDSPNEEIRIQSIKLLGYFLSRSTSKRKQDVMGPNNLFMLLRERLIKFTPLSIDTYNALFEILVETPIETIRSNGAGAFGGLRIENPMILKVIATLITDGKKSSIVIKQSTSDLQNSTKSSSGSHHHHHHHQQHGESRSDRNKIKKLFISDLWRLLVNNRENRRLVLQMSVWQHWLINLVEDRADHVVRDQILAIFRVLLYHAIKYEYGGWRVWIDTLAIIHAKVSFDDFMSQFGGDNKKSSNNSNQLNSNNNSNGLPSSSSTTSSTVNNKSSGVNGNDSINKSNNKQTADSYANQGKESKLSTNQQQTDTVDSKDQDSDKGQSSVTVATPEVADEEDSRPEDEREISSTLAATTSEPIETEAELIDSNCDNKDSRKSDSVNEPIDPVVTSPSLSSSSSTTINESVAQNKDELSNEGIEGEKDDEIQIEDLNSSGGETVINKNTESTHNEEIDKSQGEIDSTKGSNQLVSSPELLSSNESVAQNKDKSSTEEIKEKESESISGGEVIVDKDDEDGSKVEDETEEKNDPSNEANQPVITSPSSLSSSPTPSSPSTAKLDTEDDKVKETEVETEEKEEKEEKEVREPVISTISSSQTNNKSLENEEDEKKPQPEDTSDSGTTEADLAPSRAYRKHHPNSLKEFYTNLLQGGRQRTSANSVQGEKVSVGSASATPAFRIPEFRWSPLHLKLLNDLFYSIECDLQMWKSQSSKDTVNSGSSRDPENKSGVILTVSATQLDQILQHPDNQIYIINSIHLFSQLCDNIIIASGGLLPLLATATGGNHSNSGNSANGVNPAGTGGEGLTLAQANALLYRLVNMADILCFAATHIAFSELESEKNMSSGGILRQCLRLVCTVAVKNCLAVQKHHEENGVGSLDPLNLGKDGYSLGTSINAAAELFGDFGGYHGNDSGRGVGHGPDTSDIILSDMAPSANPDLVSGSYLPFHHLPIKDPSKLLQEMDVNRLRACIYRDAEADTKQSQFLALATLYFISVLMVSEYRDIIESKSASSAKDSGKKVTTGPGEGEEPHDEDIGTSGLSEIKSNLSNPITVNPTNIGNMLTSKLEARLSSICPLLREIMCDFASFLSKTLLGSHGQDLVSKEAVRTFRRPNASPVELVMLLCSQEWQNTLQKNAGLAFIELINEGRLLSHAMKDHIVRVAMEAEFILNRLRADDVSKHEQFSLACLETLAARAHEEALINSLINSAKRRDRMIFTRFRESLSQQQKRLEIDRSKLFYKLDTWEDDARRRRRFLLDPYGEENVSRMEAIINESKTGKEEKDGQSLPTHLIVPKQQQPATNRTESDEETELFLWESEDMSSSVNGDVDDRPASAAEFVGTVLYSVECNLIWNIYSIEGTLQITANEIFFEAININDTLSVDGSCVSKQSNDGSGTSVKVKSRPSSGSSRDKLPEENLKGLAGSSSSKPGRGGFRDLDLRVLRYCDLITYNGKVPFNEIRAIFSRRYLLQPVALEIFLAQRTSVMFVFPDSETVKKVVKYLPAVGVGVKYGIPQSRRASLMTPKQLFAASNMTHKWQKREITNFEYLMFLNTIAGRTYQDLNQYPVFPWILTNYDTPELDLSQPTNFRDLSKPIGALNSERRAEFIERYNSWDNSHIPAFHYGTHYSTAAFTLGWLIRLEPFHSAYLALQDGRLENESRLFTSIREAWLGSLMGGHQNVKELIPELFYLPEVLSGTSPRGAPTKKLRNVDLPKWADSPEHFIRLHRMALESDLVSCQLHQWIDLIFGYKQRGPEAVRAVNVFYYLTYEGNIDLSTISCNDPALKDAIEAQIRHFGQTPSQLSTEPHPPRSSALHVSPLMFSPVMDEICMSIKFPFNAAITAIAACTMNTSSNSTGGSSTSSTNSSANSTSLSSIPSSIVTINSAQHYHIHKWNPKESNQPFTLDSALTTSSSTSSSSSSNKRHLLDTTSLCCLSSSSAPYSPRYIVTIDSKYIIMAPFYDNSFRVYSTETGKLTQVIYGHRGLVTCLARSECNVAVDFYVASGSVDCSVLFWTWNAKYAQIEGNNGASAISGNPLPKLILTGHESMIMSLLISAELGLISSGSKNLILVHSITNGDCITAIDVRKRHLNVSDAISLSFKPFADNCDDPVDPMDEGNNKNVEVKVTMEASMTAGEVSIQYSPSKERKTSGCSEKSSSRSTNSKVHRDSTDSNVNLNTNCGDDDYFINNLVLARELAFIVGTACSVDRPLSSSPSSSKSSSSLLSSLTSTIMPNTISSSSSSTATTTTVAPSEPTALLFTYNLRGELHKCISFPRPKDISSLMMTITRDGEYIILSESPYMIKILRTFDVTPLYALNTSDLLTACPNPDLAVRETGQGTNAIKSILLVDYKYLLVGTENGRLIIYKLDFNRWHHEYSSRY
ncbi:LOW QUALITY PROTEIN: neurobeachin-like [Panonychus citri]|uniref:LOW QUALITY PROTEIN: neurobeachin-like n=1 Tax=Panonychus citri TaxID=50023 RepID=UPI002307D5C6|nr:LOW QUALITY PROTEIN: neurobeachin-like [Panonychus citri]